MADTKVKPKDDVKVYSTEKLQGIYPKIGTLMIVHREQAKKLIEAGKATAAAPKEAK